MTKDNSVYLLHIRDALQQIVDYTRGVSEEQFRQSRLLQDGIVRELEIVGEASRNLSDEFRHGHEEVPWAQIIGLRNRITHEYFNLNLDIIWEIVRDDVPTLKQQVLNLLARN